MGVMFDTTRTLTAAQLAALRQADVTCVSRYLSPAGGLAKDIDPAEAELYGPAGMQLVINWEHDADTMVIASSADITRWADDCATRALACGYRPGRAVLVSVDVNVGSDRIDKTLDNLRTFAGRLARVGLDMGTYGSGYVLRTAHTAGIGRVFWQSMSRGWYESATAAPYVHLWQNYPPVVLAGVSGDTSRILIPTFGQLGDDMEQSDKITGNLSRGNTVGDFMADQVNERDWWYGVPGTAGADGKNPPPAGSRLDLLMKFIQAGGVTPAPVDPAVVTTAVRVALADPTILAAIAKAVNDDEARRQVE